MPCWPATTEWSSLNDTISGRLIKTTPVASVCYRSEPTFNLETCQFVRSNWTTWPFHSANPTSVGDPSLDNACAPIFPNGTSLSGNSEAGKQGCSLGSYPPYVINATGAEDVQAAVSFAKKYNLRLNIKNTGHSGERRLVFPCNHFLNSLAAAHEFLNIVSTLEVFRMYLCVFQVEKG